MLEKCRCQVMGCVGEGAFSKVYRLKLIRECGEERELACKVSRVAELLKREAVYLNRVQHPLFPKLFGFSRKGEEGYLLMEYIPGMTLKQYLRNRNGLPLWELYQLAENLAEGIRYLHQLEPGYLFRDLKPENIIVTEPGGCKLVDFGCVCVGKGAENIAGTPGYGAPEQLRGGGRLTESCDIYGFGRVLETMADHAKTDARIRKLIAACCLEDAKRRPPDMDWVLLFLHNRHLTGFQKDVLGGKVSFEQNICKNSVKNY